jgi:hypothetical protein
VRIIIVVEPFWRFGKEIFAWWKNIFHYASYIELRFNIQSRFDLYYLLKTTPA